MADSPLAGAAPTENEENVSLPLLPYQQDIVEELLEQDGITVMGKGMGLPTIAAALLAVHYWTESSGGVVLVIGASQAQRKQIAAELTRVAPTAPAIADVTADMTARERSEKCIEVKHLFITTRILVVDFLTQRIPLRHVAGLLVVNAHRATDQSGEGFAVRLLRSENKEAFVRGLSDDPAACSAGLSTTERMMRALHVRRLFLWPRYQAKVQANLPQVCEVQCDLTERMVTIQQALVKLLDSMLKQVQRTNKLDSSELRLSDAFSRSFESAVRRQLDPVWTTLSASTQTLVRDMRTVQELVRYLLRFNSVSFLRYLQCLRAASGSRTEWMLHSGANTVFQEAKTRVYRVDYASPRQAHSSRPKAAAALVPVLEEMPKWTALRDVVDEIQTARGLLASRRAAADCADGRAATRTPAAARDMGSDAGDGDVDDDVVIVDRDTGAARCDAPRRGGHATPRMRSASSPELAAAGAGGAVTSAAAAESGRQASPALEAKEGTEEDAESWVARLSAERIAACGAASALIVTSEKRMVTELRSVLEAPNGRAYLQKLYDMYLVERLTGERSDGAAARRGGATKRGRGGAAKPSKGATRREQNMYKLQMLNATPEEDSAIIAAADTVLDGMEADDAMRPKKRAHRAAAAAAHLKGYARHAEGARGAQAGAAVAHDKERRGSASTGAFSRLEGVHVVSIEDACEHMLSMLRPVFVVLHDLDLSWIRLLEVYQAAHPRIPLKVYLLFYNESIDLHQYELSSVREKEAFKKLIFNKSHMVLPLDETGEVAIQPKGASDLMRSQYLASGMAAGNAVTRKAGGHAVLGGHQVGTIVVDVREFMSPLPAVLHSRGFEVLPVTLEVADFVLTDSICVERKAIPDLISSLDSGRLYTQATAMCKHYKTPVLLIEFDPSRAFALQSLSDIGTEIRSNNVASKLVVLLHNFPSLRHLECRLVWSRSLHATADMFALLKGSAPQPDATAAAEVGVDGADTDGDGVLNPIARDMLLAMPGVSMANVHSLMDAAGTLSGLARLSLPSLQDAVGKISGKQLHDFLHAPYPVA